MNKTHNAPVARLRRRIAAALIAAMFVSAMPAVALAAPFKLFVDPGHGGKDPGAVSGGLKEKNTNLQISRYVVKAAKRQGWSVKTSRNSDQFIPLKLRARRANRWKANAFVSIHSNSTGRKNLGSMTIYRTKRGGRLSRHIMNELYELTPYGDIGARRDVRGLAVLNYAKMPATVVEVLSVTPAQERSQLRDPEVQKQAAEAIVKGVASSRGMKYKAPAKPKATAPENETVVTPVARLESETTVSTEPQPGTGESPSLNAPEQNGVAAAEAAGNERVEATVVESGDTTAPQTRPEASPTDGLLPALAAQSTGELVEAVFGLLVK